MVQEEKNEQWGQGQGGKRPIETISIATYFCSLYF